MPERAAVHEVPSRRILYITYHFPPAGGVGVPRAVSYTRNLPRHGFKVTVIAPNHPATPVIDRGLLESIPPETEVIRVFNPALPYSWRDKLWRKLAGDKQPASRQVQSETAAAPGRVKTALRNFVERIFRPDPQRFWAMFARRVAARELRRHHYDAVLVNSPPFSLMPLTTALRREFPNVKILLEIRDDWLGYHFQKFDPAVNPGRLAFAQRAEREAIAAADFVVPVTDAQTAQIANRYPDQPREKFITVPNGYDPALFGGLARRLPQPGKMTIAYLGTVYANPVYAPGAFLDAVDSLPQPILANVEVRFIGRIAAAALPLFEGRKANIVRTGFLPQAEAARQLEDADYVLLIVNDATALAGKLFDYLGARIPVLALTPPEGEIGRILRKTRCGMSVDPTDTRAVRQMLIEAWQRLDSGQGFDPDMEEVRRYTWPASVAGLLKQTGLSAERS